MGTSASALALQIIERLGGTGNIRTVENCITRLRVTVADMQIVDADALRSLTS